MKIEQIYTGCLAQGAYYIESNGEAAIIDPLRETQPYIDLLEKNKVKLKYIFETHFHADFVSGHVDLSEKTGAQIVYGPAANPTFPALIAQDNALFALGNVWLKAIHTPGHTLESTTYLLIDANGKETALFTGDTLFLGDVGRPDLAQKGAHLTQEDLAGLLYDSLYNKILPLADDITVYPAHGAGSACGKNMMKETIDTLGSQKRINYALNQPNKDAFIAAVTDGLLPPPAYFAKNVAMNKEGYKSFDDVLTKGLNPLTPQSFIELAQSSSVLILDTRDVKTFAKGFVPQAINISLQGDFAPWVGAMIKDVNQPILLVTTIGKEQETITRLSRIGFDHVLGYLEGGFESWEGEGFDVDSINQLNATQFEQVFDENTAIVIDIRKETEYSAQHLAVAFHKPLVSLNDWITTLPTDKHFYIHCASGYRSSIAASILQARGIRNFTEIEGGFAALQQTRLEQTTFVCPSKVLNPAKV